MASPSAIDGKTRAMASSRLRPTRLDDSPGWANSPGGPHPIAVSGGPENHKRDSDGQGQAPENQSAMDGVSARQEHPSQDNYLNMDEDDVEGAGRRARKAHLIITWA